MSGISPAVDLLIFIPLRLGVNKLSLDWTVLDWTLDWTVLDWGVLDRLTEPLTGPLTGPLTDDRSFASLLSLSPVVRATAVVDATVGYISLGEGDILGLIGAVDLGDFLAGDFLADDR